jgi:hypothetical protein
MKKILLLLTLALVTQLTFAQNIPSYVPSDSLVGYWGFDGNANDASGNGNNGTVNGATLTTDRNGNVNSAYSFDGVNDYIQGVSSNLPIGNSARSISAWISLPSINNDYINFISSWGYGDASQSSANKAFGFFSNLNTAIGIWQSFGASENNEQYSYNFQTNAIYHLVVTIDNNGFFKFYINSNLVYNNQIVGMATVENGGVFRFGRSTHTNTDGWAGYFFGTLDDIGIWNRALTQEEITQLYTGTTQTPAAIQSFTVNSDTTGHEGSTYAWSINPAAPLAVITGNGTNSISIAWGNTPEGNYSVQAIETNSLGCVTSTVNTLVYVAGPNSLTVVSPVNYCYKATATPLTATPSTGSALKWYSSAIIKTALASAPTPLTTTSGSKTYYVSERTAAGVESARLPIVVNVRSLPITPTSITSTQSALICKYIGTTNEVKFTTTAVEEGLSYVWTVPEGATIVSGDGTSEIKVSFENVTLKSGNIGAVTVKSVNGNGCVSSAKSLILNTKTPKAPTAVTLSIPNTTNLISKVGPYIGTTTPFTLTATDASNTAHHYRWLLPSGVSVTAGATSSFDNNDGTTTWTSTEGVLTIHFENVAAGVSPVQIKVYSVGGCGESNAKIKNLVRALPTVPAKLTLTDDAISRTTALTKVSAYIGKITELKLTATPITTQGAEATSFLWVVPSGVNVLAGATLVEDNGATKTYSGTDSTLTINLNNIASGVYTIPLTVYGVNGSGTSGARKLTLFSPKPIISTLTASSTKFDTCVSTTFTATNIPGASYAWTLPAGASGVSTTNSIVVTFNSLAPSKIAISCIATDGTGSSAAKSFSISKGGCTRIESPTPIAQAFEVVAYPNPSSKVFTLDVRLAKGTAAEVQVYDILGRLIEQRKVSSGAIQIGAAYPSGTYILKMSQGENQKTVRVIKR